MARFGISAALLTPFAEEGGIDIARLASHAAHVLETGADGVTIFGTTGEGASIGAAEREAALGGLAASGFPPDRLVLGVCATAVEEAVAQAMAGHRAGARDVLLLPPFYFKNVSEDGLFAWHAAVFAALPEDARVILYHIPQVSGVGLPVSLVARLFSAFPGRVRGVKDSSGDWSSSEALLDLSGPEVLIGDERLLHRGAAKGAAGAISGVANLHPARLARVLDSGTEDPAISALTSAIVALPVIAALKAVMAEETGDPGWERLRAPLEPLDVEARTRLIGAAREAASG